MNSRRLVLPPLALFFSSSPPQLRATSFKYRADRCPSALSPNGVVGQLRVLDHEVLGDAEANEAGAEGGQAPVLGVREDLGERHVGQLRLVHARRKRALLLLRLGRRLPAVANG